MYGLSSLRVFISSGTVYGGAETSSRLIFFISEVLREVGLGYHVISVLCDVVWVVLGVNCGSCGWLKIGEEMRLKTFLRLGRGRGLLGCWLRVSKCGKWGNAYN